MIRFVLLRGSRRHPILRAALALLGLALLALFSVFALAVGAVVLLAWTIRRALRPSAPRVAPHRSSPHAPPGVIDGEYRVVGIDSARVGTR